MITFRTDLSESTMNLLVALDRVLDKFHHETDCGKGFHWAECESAYETIMEHDPAYDPWWLRR
jgi:hypothetical protein